MTAPNNGDQENTIVDRTAVQPLQNYEHDATRIAHCLVARFPWKASNDGLQSGLQGSERTS